MCCEYIDTMGYEVYLAKYDDGYLKRRQVNGALFGELRYYFLNGNLQQSGEYYNRDFECGIWKEYDIEGHLLKEINKDVLLLVAGGLLAVLVGLLPILPGLVARHRGVAVGRLDRGRPCHPAALLEGGAAAEEGVGHDPLILSEGSGANGPEGTRSQPGRPTRAATGNWTHYAHPRCGEGNPFP